MQDSDNPFAMKKVPSLKGAINLYIFPSRPIEPALYSSQGLV